MVFQVDHGIRYFVHKKIFNKHIIKVVNEDYFVNRDYFSYYYIIINDVFIVD